MEDQFRQIVREEVARIFAAQFASLSHIQSEFLTLKEAKLKYDLHGATLYRHVNNKHLSLIKLGGKSYLKRDEVERLFVKVK